MKKASVPPSHQRQWSVMRYHEATKHSEISIRTSGHYLDWENKPSPFKIYRNLPSTSLPHDFPKPRISALKAISGLAYQQEEEGKKIDVGSLAEILFFSAGLTRKMWFGSGPYYMRAASATGALYPIELYVVSGDIPGLKAGVYHFNPLDFVLVQFRQGDFRSYLAKASDESVARSPFTIAMTSLAWRNAWKYEARSYRHWFWDAGVIAANLLATCTAEDFSSRLLLGFVDNKIDRLLGLEELKEATICLAPVGEGTRWSAGPIQNAIPELKLDVEPLSKGEVDYPIIWEANKAGELLGADEVEEWKRRVKEERPEKFSPTGPIFKLQSLSEQSARALSDTILQRGSSRRFSQQPITFEALSTILKASTGPVRFDFISEDQSLIKFYFIANAVQGLPSGSYHYDKEKNSVEQLKVGSFRSMSGYLSLGQPLFSQASVMFFLTADLNNVIGTFGERGYRAAQFEAGVRAGKIYLASYALQLGASGSTFYDDAVTEFFSPHAEHESPMIAIGIGHPGYAAKSGKILVPRSSSKQTGILKGMN